MGFSGKYCRFTVLTFLFVLCLTIAAAQDNPPVPRGPGRDNSGEFRLLQGALVERPQPENRIGELMRLLAAPAAQKAIGLSDEQRKKIDDITFNLQRTTIQQEAALRVQQMDLDRLMRADAPDRPAIDKKIQEIAQAQAAVMRTRINGLLDAMHVLTKEQQEKLNEHVRIRLQRLAPQPTVPPAAKVPPLQPRPPAN